MTVFASRLSLMRGWCRSSRLGFRLRMRALSILARMGRILRLRLRFGLRPWCSRCGFSILARRTLWFRTLGLLTWRRSSFHRARRGTIARVIRGLLWLGWPRLLARTLLGSRRTGRGLRRLVAVFWRTRHSLALVTVSRWGSWRLICHWRVRSRFLIGREGPWLRSGKNSGLPLVDRSKLSAITASRLLVLHLCRGGSHTTLATCRQLSLRGLGLYPTWSTVVADARHVDVVSHRGVIDTNVADIYIV